MNRGFPLLVAFVCAGMSARATPTLAQDAREQALALAADGMDDVHNGDYVPARAKLMRSLELYPHAGTAYNLGELHRRMGDILSELALLEALIEGTYGELSEAQLAQARTKRDAAAEAVATLRVVVRGPPRADLRIDGERVGELRSGRAHEERVNPGTRRVFVTARGHETAEEEVSLAPGARESLELTLAARVLAEPQEAAPRSSTKRRRILGITLGAALLVAGGVTAAILARRGSDPELSGVTVVGW